MRYYGVRALALAVATLALALVGAGTRAQSPPEPIWPTYHYNSVRGGQNRNSTDIENPATLGAVWVFPRDVGGADEETTIVDDRGAGFTPHSDWQDMPYKASDSWNVHFYWAPAIPTTIRPYEDPVTGVRKMRKEPYGGTPIEAVWRLPAALPRGLYQVYVWVPSDYPRRSPYNNPEPLPQNTTKARYRVYDDHGWHEINYNDALGDEVVDYVYFNQQDGGGWKLLTPTYFSFAGAGDYRVVVSNWTGDYIPTYPPDEDKENQEYQKFLAQNLIVVADAIKFVPALGQEIYSSPTSADLWYEWTSSDGKATWSGYAPFVYVGTVEAPLIKLPEASDMGSVYCINSVTPTKEDIWDAEGNPKPGVDPRWPEMSKLLGTAKWRYPDTNPLDREELEGPIEGGVYSSPTLVKLDYGGTDRLVCYVAGMDLQVYALDAENGDLLWKGPGVTVSEGNPLGWYVVEPALDCFGGAYRWAKCTEATSGAEQTVEWFFDDKLEQTGAPQGTNSENEELGWWYAVYAWIPVYKEAAELPRITDAVYTITHITGEASDGTTRITVDQSRPENQGKWVKLGSSYFNVKSVELSNATNLADPGTYGVVADAVMIVPDTVDGFSYSSPVHGKIGAPDMIFAACSGGRVIGFDAVAPRLPDPAAIHAPVGRARWIYPSVRTKRIISDPVDQDQDPLGGIGASPAFHENKLFVATYDDVFGGRVIALTNLDNEAPAVPTVDWTFPNASDEQPFDPDDPSTINAGQWVSGFTASPAVDADRIRNQLLIGSVGGVFYCLHLNQGTYGTQLKWKYPAAPTVGSAPLMPLGAFRYSTPSIALINFPRAWCASSDGKIYSFDISEGVNERRLWLEYNDDGTFKQRHGPEWYYEPNCGSPVQGAIALDGGFGNNGNPITFAGDMNGTLHWFSSKTGLSLWTDSGKNYRGWRTEGELFSSPNVSNIEIGATNQKVSWVYVGCSDGRIYAFSDENGAWGGRWSGGAWPFEGEPNEGQLEEVAGPNTEIQFDIFPSDFLQASERLEPEPANYVEPTWPTSPGGSVLECIVSKAMKIVPLATVPTLTTDEEIDTYLTTEAKKRRDYAFEAANRAGSSMPLYFEWGETINLILWNLPELDRIHGSNNQSKRASIRFNFTNASPGETAGSQIRMTGTCSALKEYTVLKEPVLTKDPDNPDAPDQYEALEYASGDAVKRSYALARIEIKSRASRPPSPGPGWILEVTIRRQAKAGTGDESITLRLAKLKPGTGGIKYEPVYDQVDIDDDGTIDSYEAKPETLGINNPLAIRDDGDLVGAAVTSLAWPRNPDFSTWDERYHPEAHFNGNSVAGVNEVGEATLSIGKLPTLNLNIQDRGGLRPVAHGTGSREGWLWFTDRSATACTIRQMTIPPITDTLQRFRIEGADLRWNGGPQAVEASGGIMFPWDQGPGSADYPHIYQRSQNYRKAADDGDPRTASTDLPPLLLRKYGDDWDTDYGLRQASCPIMRPETVFVSVNVPRFQPANYGSSRPNPGSRYDLSGYSRTTQAYIDSDGNREWNSGNAIRGRPTTYQETYRPFKVWLSVPPDPKIEVEEQLVDVGRTPHGLGEELLEAGSGFDLFTPFNADPMIRQWFKRLTIKNAGNVNLYGLHIPKTLSDASGNIFNIGLLSDQANPTAPLPGAAIVSSFDGVVPVFSFDPFTTTSSDGALGYTLSKPRVGDPDPTIMTIPDKRKWDTNFDFTRDSAGGILGAGGWPDDQPLSPEVSIKVPLTQPIGTYISFNPLFGDSTVPVGAWFGRPARLALAAPSFQLKATVRESQLTGGVTPTTLPQIDVPPAAPGDPPLPRSGDTTPAAFRDGSGNVHLIWSTNRLLDPSLYPAAPTDAQLADLAGAPWFIRFTTLRWTSTGPSIGWQTFENAHQRWWGPLDATAPDYLPDFQWPDPTTNIMPWKFDDNNTGYLSVRHYSPVFAENLDAAPDADSDRTWLAWIGSADREDPATNKVSREYAIFYTDASQGDVTGTDHKIYAIQQEPAILGHDLSMEKRYPSLAVYGDRMWAFWQGGDKGNWSIFYSTNDDPDRIHNPVEDGGQAAHPWSPDMRLRTPDCLASVGSPNVLYRQFWVDLTGEEPSFANAHDLLDVVYAGTSKLRQNSDVLLSRYLAITTKEQQAGNYSPNVLPSRTAQPMPRVFAEKLERDPKFGFFTSRHVAWMRLDSGKVARGEQTPMVDDWGAYNTGPGVDPNLPFIHVLLPIGYKLPDEANELPEGTIVSATDGSIYVPDSAGNLTQEVAPQPIMPRIDEATGVYTYRYPQPETASILGETLVDFSEGIVRFTRPLVEKTRDDGSVSAPEVYADYTPQTWRLTTDLAADSSPRAFIEHTRMNKLVYPGMCDWDDDKPAPVDRLWAFWRKAGTGIESSTIYYRTFRVGIDVTSLRTADGEPALPILMKPDGTPVKIGVTGNLGPWEVDRTGRYIWFTQVDERYRSLFTPDNTPALGASPGPITIQYDDGSGSGADSSPIEVYDVYWLPELPEQSLFGFAADTNVNEGSIYAFADPQPMAMTGLDALGRGTFTPLPSSKIWVFWTSTRAGTSDLFWETLSPNFGAR